jgi:hypothetical protein
VVVGREAAEEREDQEKGDDDCPPDGGNPRELVEAGETFVSNSCWLTILIPSDRQLRSSRGKAG